MYFFKNHSTVAESLRIFTAAAQSKIAPDCYVITHLQIQLRIHQVEPDHGGWFNIDLGFGPGLCHFQHSRPVLFEKEKGALDSIRAGRAAGGSADIPAVFDSAGQLSGLVCFERKRPRLIGFQNSRETPMDMAVL